MGEGEVMVKKGYQQSDETKLEIGQKSRDRKPSEETRQRMRESQKRAGQDPELRRLRSENARRAEQRRREEEDADPELAEERRRTRGEAVKKGWLNRSRKTPEEVRQKISETLKGRVFSEEHRAKLRGTKSAEHIRKMSEARKGWQPTEQQIARMREGQRRARAEGKFPLKRTGIGNRLLMCNACKQKFPREAVLGNSGFCSDCTTHTKLCDCGCGEEMFRYDKEGYVRSFKDASHRARNSARRRTERGTFMGMGNPAWNGGASFLPYDDAFNDDFKERMKRRQDCRCADKHLGPCSQDGLIIHHIDRNKMNSVPENCVALCRHHHGRSHNKEARTRHYAFVKVLMQNEEEAD